MNRAPIEHAELKAAIANLGGQKAVANRFGIPYRTVQNWYRGERTPPEYVARMIVLFDEDELNHLVDNMYNEDVISELKRENEDLSERDKADTKRYIEDQEALAWYESELKNAKAHNEVLQKQFDTAMELAQNRRREVEALDMEVCELREQVEALQHELEKQKKAREVWMRQAGALTK